MYSGQFLIPHVNKPTRWRGTDTPHVLDLVFTNEENMVSELEYLSPLGKSDHCVLCATFLMSNGHVCVLFVFTNHQFNHSYVCGYLEKSSMAVLKLRTAGLLYFNWNT
jgi:hypothetical protein